MNSQKKSTLLIIIILLLIVLCIIEGMIILKQDHVKRPAGIFNNSDNFSLFLKDKYQKERDEHWDYFDRFFNDDFFHNKKDAFKEMDRFQQEMKEMLEEGTDQSFGHSWDSWFNNRFLGKQENIDIDIVETTNTYIVEVTIPNPKENKLNIEVNEKGISISGEMIQLAEKEDSKGHIIGKQEIRQNISRRIPLPSGADHEDAQIEYKKNKIIITLRKKEMS